MRLTRHGVLFLSPAGVVLAASELRRADIRVGDCVLDRMDNEHRVRFARAIKFALEGETTDLCSSYRVGDGWLCFSATICGIVFKGSKMVMAIAHPLGPSPQCEEQEPAEERRTGGQ